jgi:16S rRNA (guanine527-N7)-methyltransferase
LKALEDWVAWPWPLDDTQKHAFELICNEHLKWNDVFNLSAHRTREQVINDQLIDSLSVVHAISGDSVLDVGTGPGFPGLPLAIMYPDIEFSLLDSNSKKLSFATRMVSLLRLDNVRIIHQRIERFAPVAQYDQIISRAFCSLSDMIQLASPFLSTSGQILAMKGPGVFNEQADAELKYPDCTIVVDQLNHPQDADKKRFLATVTWIGT